MWGIQRIYLLFCFYIPSPCHCGHLWPLSHPPTRTLPPPFCILLPFRSDDGMTALLKKSAPKKEQKTELASALRPSFAQRRQGSLRRQKDAEAEDEEKGRGVVDYVSNKTVEEVLRIARCVENAHGCRRGKSSWKNDARDFTLFLLSSSRLVASAKISVAPR